MVHKVKGFMVWGPVHFKATDSLPLVRFPTNQCFSLVDVTFARRVGGSQSSVQEYHTKSPKLRHPQHTPRGH